MYTRAAPWENALLAVSHRFRTLVALAAFSAGLALTVSVARADHAPVLVYPGHDAAAYARDSGTISRIPPDPPPLKSRKQWVFDLRWSKGDPYLLAVNPLDLGEPQETPRVMGRFAIELFEGKTLLERVRFDFPMLGPPEPDAGYGAPPSLTAKLTTRIGVMFPAVDRGTRLELWDRATDRRWPLPWPPGGESAQNAASAARATPGADAPDATVSGER